MRPSCFAALVLSAAFLTIGCQQAPSYPLTPVGTLGPAPTLAPVSATTSGIGPLGGRTRIPPPATGSYAVPNNYMGGTPSIGEVGANGGTFDSFRNSEGVRPAGFEETARQGGVATTFFGSGSGNQPTNSSAPSPSISAQLGGMQVNDSTGAPPPPGYRGSGPTSIPNQQMPANGASGFAPNSYPNQQTQPLHPAPPVRIPRTFPGAEMASRSGMSQPSLSIAQRPGSAGFAQEVPIQPSRLEPSFSGMTPQFQPQPPSTDPVDKNLQAQPESLPWRRPTAAY